MVLYTVSTYFKEAKCGFILQSIKRDDFSVVRLTNELPVDLVNGNKMNIVIEEELIWRVKKNIVHLFKYTAFLATWRTVSSMGLQK